MMIMIYMAGWLAEGYKLIHEILSKEIMGA